MSLFKIAPQLEIPAGLLYGSGGGLLGLICLVTYGTTRWLTRHHIHWGKAREEFADKKASEKADKDLGDRVSELKTDMNTGFTNLTTQMTTMINLITKKNGG